jgi:hypothetical protein
VTATLSFAAARRGDGGAFINFVEGMDPYPPFPSGTVEKTLSLGGGLEWELPRNSSAGFDVQRIRIENQGNAVTPSDWSTSVRIHLTWDL